VSRADGIFTNVHSLKAIQIYTKAVPDATYVDIEKKMRDEGFKIFLIALVRSHLVCEQE
jgi:hypothetical protein